MSDVFPYDQLPIPTVPDLTDQIERTTELIGRGGYGSVYKGRWLGKAANATPPTIAIKIIELVPLREKTEQTKRFRQIVRELSLWCSIQHENILPLLGIARIDGDTNIPAFVCPWMENGNAREFCLRNPDFPPILILYDVINGLHYLHTSQPEIVHGDIKAVNVLINNRCEACLCDFGLSRFLTDNTLWKTTATHAGGTVRWMAPELLNEDACTPTKESDMYAYAMTCYEILSGNVPFKSVKNDIAIPPKVMKGQRPDRIELVHSNFMWDIITRCWKQEPGSRLATEKVLELLRPTVDWKIDWKKKVEEALAKIGKKDVALAKVEKEMAVLKEKVAETLAKAEEEKEKALAKAEEDLQVAREEKNAALAKAEEEKEKALAKAEEDLKVAREEKDAVLAKAEEEMKALRKDQAAAERKKNDVEEKYERKVKELQELREQLEKNMGMHQVEAAELRQEAERAREGSSLLTEVLMSLRHTSPSLHEVVETFKHEAQARGEEAVTVQHKQQNEITVLHEEVARAPAEAEKAEVHRNQTKDQPDGVVSQCKGIRELKQRMKEAQTKIEETDVGLGKVEAEISVLKGQKADQRKPYTGTEKSLVIGIDISVHFSGVSYALLEPGKVPRIQPVTWFPGETQETGDSKVFSSVRYDQDGHAISAGLVEKQIHFEVSVLRRTEWFDVLVYPSRLAAEKRSQLEKIWSLQEAAEDKYIKALKDESPGPAVFDDFKIVVRVIADFLKYLLAHAEEYIEETERNIDPTFRSSIEKNTYFVLTHPNEWKGKQQSQMRDAAVAAGIVDRSTAADRIIFLTEGEAILHFCLDKIPNLHQVRGDGLLMVDCGESLDISAYSQTNGDGYEKIVSPDCLLHYEHIFNDFNVTANNYLKGKFKDSQFLTDENSGTMSALFKDPRGAKCMFHNPTTPYFFKFGGLLDNDRKHGITNGKIKVEGVRVAEFLESSIQDIIKSIGGIIDQCRNNKDVGVSIKYVLLVGVYGRSDYLYARLRDYFKSSNIVVLRPDIDCLNMVVANGAVSYFVDRHPSARNANYSEGIEVDDKQTNIPPLQAVVPKTDSLSVTDVANLVKRLNDEIEQMVNLLTESLSDLEPPSSDNESEMDEHDPLKIQLTLQTGLANVCSTIVNDSSFWYNGSIFHDQYRRMAEKEGQSAANEWRAKASNCFDLPQCEDANKKYLTDVLRKLATAAVGVTLKNSESLLSQYNQRVEVIAKMTAKLHKTITEDMTSSELITYTVSRDTEFDTFQMEDSENNPRFTPHGKVICTQEMGLLCRKRVEPKKPRGPLKDWGVTMKAKVVLAGTLKEYYKRM